MDGMMSLNKDPIILITAKFVNVMPIVHIRWIVTDEAQSLVVFELKYN